MSTSKERFPTIDTAKAKLAAYAVVAGFMAIMLVFGIRSLSGPNLSEGDRVESLPCPLCQGSGQLSGKRCPACLGTKKLKAVVPGPKHPVEVKGTVRALSAFKTKAEAEQISKEEAADRRVSLNPVKGAISGASVVFQSSNDKVEFNSKATGKFWGVLPPDTYRVRLSVEGFKSVDKEVVVSPLSEPIWPKVAGLESLPTQHLQLDLILEPTS